MGLLVKKLNVSLDGKHILHDIDLKVDDGEFFSLLGPSGCGKSTLLKTIAGLIQPKGGEISFNDQDLLVLPPQKRKAVIVFQDQRLFRNMSVGENVTFALRNKGVPKRERKIAAEKYLAMVQLEGFADRRPHEISGGQAQRVALARALASEPNMLLLDEPFSALDANLRDDMRALVSILHEETGITTIMVTHDQHEALSMSNRVAIMDDGRIVQTGTPKELFGSPATVEIAEFFSEGDVVDGMVVNGVFSAEKLSVPVDLQDGSYRAVVRQSALNQDESGIECLIAKMEYQGETILAALSFGGDIEVQYTFASTTLVHVGDHVKFALDPDAMLFFPA